MDERITRALRSVKSLEELSRLEENVNRQQALTDEVRTALRAKAIEFGRALVAEKTGLDLSHLTPAQEKIVLAASEYAAVQKQRGKPATRTFNQLRNRGLLEAAEASVTKPKATQGFEALADADLEELSYEQIIVDHPEEFSARAQWYARRRLKLPNDTEKPPALGSSLTQERTERLLKWLEDKSVANDGHLSAFTNADAAAAIECWKTSDP